jgi:hexosaminidase
MVWGDKFLDAYLPGYGPCGGARIEMHHPITGIGSGVIPPTWRSIDLIPADLRIMHWYWSVDSRLETEFLKRNLDTVYGNFSGPDIPDWSIRQSSGIRGAVISNWSALKDENLQRNGFFYNLAYSTVLFWNPEYDDSWYEQLVPAVFAELLRYRLVGVAAQPGDSLPGSKGKWLDILHTSAEDRDYAEFVDGTFIDQEKDTLGHYILTYNDGKTASVPIIYGHNISGLSASWDRTLESAYTVYQTDKRLREVAFTTCPIYQDGMTLYRYVMPNPYPESTLTGIKIETAKPEHRLILRQLRLTDGLEWISG